MLQEGDLKTAMSWIICLRNHEKLRVKSSITGALIFSVLIACSMSSVDDDRYPPLDVNVANLKGTVEFLTAMCPYRNYRNPEALTRVAFYLENRLRECGLQTEQQPFSVGGTTYFNVIGSINPERQERIIVGAHYDVFGDQPGADDNASGIAGLLEVSRLANQLSSKIAYRVDFVAYCLEEPPFFGTWEMGSSAHARSLHDANVAVRGMISLEMIGFFTEEEGSQEYPLSILKFFYPSTGNFIGVVGNIRSRGLIKDVETHMQAASVKVESLSAPALVTGIDFSDHRNYWKFGYSGIMITDTAFYRNPHYHQPSDTMETLDFNTMGEVVKGVVWALVNMK